MREIAISMDYMQKVRAAIGLPFIPMDGTTLYLSCRKFKNNFKHIEALKQCISNSSFKNIYYYEQMRILFVFLLAETLSAWFKGNARL